MRVPLFRNLFHRRVALDPEPTKKELSPILLARPLAFIPEDALVDAGFVPSTLTTDASPFSSGFTIPTDRPSRRQSLCDRIQSLERENAQLEKSNSEIRTCNDDLASRLNALRSDYHAQRTTAIIKRQKLKDVQKARDEASNQLNELESFSQELISMLPPDMLVFATAKDAILAGESAEVALARAIEAAAGNQYSVWSRLFPHLHGTRSADHYVHAVSWAAQNHKLLQAAAARSRFWKQVALSSSTAFTVTPSPSTLSLLGFSSSNYRLSLSLRRKLAVEALAQQRRRDRDLRRITSHSALVSLARDRSTLPAYKSVSSLGTRPSGSSLHYSLLPMGYARELPTPDGQTIKPFSSQTSNSGPSIPLRDTGKRASSTLSTIEGKADHDNSLSAPASTAVSAVCSPISVDYVVVERPDQNAPLQSLRRNYPAFHLPTRWKSVVRPQCQTVDSHPAECSPLVPSYPEPQPEGCTSTKTKASHHSDGFSPPLKIFDKLFRRPSSSGQRSRSLHMTTPPSEHETRNGPHSTRLPERDALFHRISTPKPMKGKTRSSRFYEMEDPVYNRNRVFM